MAPRARVTAGLALVVLTLAGSGWIGSASASAAGRRAGSVEVAMPPSKGGRRIFNGASATVFQLKLPHGAACTQDSAHHDYRVQGFLVPAADDPAGLTFRNNGPVGANQHPLYDNFTSSYVNAQTADSTPDDAPGLIVNVPLFSYGVYSPGDLPAGSYNVGIACTLGGKVDRYWSAVTKVVADTNDKPAGFIWTVPDASRRGSTSSGWFVGLAIVVLVVAGAAYWLYQDRSRSFAPRTKTKEPR